MNIGIDDATLEDLYAWIDGVPLSRPKRNIARDFSDGVLVAELIKHFEPKLVEVHNYTSGNKTELKMTNWSLLNRKVFQKLGFEINEDVVRNIVTANPGAIENFLLILRNKLEDFSAQKRISNQQSKGVRGWQSDKPESDQYLVLRGDELFVCDLDILEKGWVKKIASPKGKGSHLPPGTNRGLINPPPATKNAKTKAVRGYVGTDMVPRQELMDREQECVAKEETIQILQAKVQRLEQLMHLKDLRIQELSGRFESTRPTGINKDVQRRDPSDRRNQYRRN